MGLLIALGGSVVYLLTLAPTVSFWDCGEFISTSYKMEVGHPPGAPLYQLLAHGMTLLAGDASRVAWWSNSLSALAGGLTAMFLFWSIVRLVHAAGSDSGLGDDSTFEQNTKHWYTTTWLAAATGSACYLFCDTAWFSAVESEVYSLSMFFSSAILWAMLRWAQSDERRGAGRWLMLVALLLGLSIGVHQLSLLTLPALLLIYLIVRKQTRTTLRSACGRAALCLLFFLIGLTPYCIIPIRAAANPPINQGDPSTMAALRDYVNRSQYEKAPLLYGRCFNSPVKDITDDGKVVYAKEMDMLFPRMWRSGDNAESYYCDWGGRHGKMVRVDGREYYKPSMGDNLTFFASYQLGYMYLRYLMWNFSGRYNNQQGFGSLQRGQFITGIAPIDRQLVGTASRVPASLHHAGHHRYFLLPFLLGLAGCFALARRSRKTFWITLLIFLTSSVLLAIYLNHPLYEPRERDYAYILSFYTFAIWIGFGVNWLVPNEAAEGWRKHTRYIAALLAAVAAPLLMASQNWSDHDRSGDYVAWDSARNLLESCEQDALLFTYGDNDTYPLWYLQEVENMRPDVLIINTSLLATQDYAANMERRLAAGGRYDTNHDDMTHMGPFYRLRTILESSQRPLYFSIYCHDRYRDSYTSWQLCGMAWRLERDILTDSVDTRRGQQLFTQTLTWHPLHEASLDETAYNFLDQYWRCALLTAEQLTLQGNPQEALAVMQAAQQQLSDSVLKNMTLRGDILHTYNLIASTTTDSATCAEALHQHNNCKTTLRRDLLKQLDYYATLSPDNQQYIASTLVPLLALQEELASQGKQ